MTRETALAELTAIKRKADAAELWRAEALAANDFESKQTVAKWRAFRKAQTARIAAGLE